VAADAFGNAIARNTAIGKANADAAVVVSGGPSPARPDLCPISEGYFGTVYQDEYGNVVNGNGDRRRDDTIYFNNEGLTSTFISGYKRGYVS
jgi:hypothetical protein